MSGSGSESSQEISGGGGRQQWGDLPPVLREGVEALLGSAVVSATSQPGGFSPGSADRVRTTDGGTAFVKAVSAAVNTDSIGIHRREAEVLAALPAALPVARLRGVVDQGDWVALVLEDVPGRHPALPWRAGELRSVLDAFAALTSTPVAGPLAEVLRPLEETLPVGWASVDADTPFALPTDLADWCHGRLDDLRALESAAKQYVHGDRLVHLDARADNLLLRPDGRVAIVDWPWAVRGAPWFDALVLMINVRLFDPGHDVAAVIAGHRAFAEMPPAAVPAVLAALSGFFTWAGSQPPPPGLPTLRAFQQEQAVVTLRWLQDCWPA